MRLTCPNCDAQYEVPDEVMPESGRDVQCSNCGQTWFQHHPDHAPDEAPDTLGSSAPDPDDEVSPPPPPPVSEPKRRQLDPAVADILRQEAEAEQAARRMRQAEPLESQPDLGLDDTDHDDTDFDDAPADGRSREARARMARLRGEAPSVSDATATAAALGSRRELLPDIEEINSTLRSSTGGARNMSDGAGPEIEAPTRQRQERGFRNGFLLIAVIALLLALLYIYAPQIAQSVPQVDPYLSGYVSFVDNLRGQLNGQVERLLLWLDNAASQSSAN